MTFKYFLLFFYSVCLVSIVHGQFNKDDLKILQALECNRVSVTLHVFSGTPNPVWKINMNQLLRIKTLANECLYENKNSTLLSKPTKRVMGYHGFTVSCSSDERVFVHGLYPVERLLLLSGLRYLSTTVAHHVKDHIGEVMSDINPKEFDNANCNHVPIVGPDTVPVYDPTTDDNGCFIQKQSENNCYAYGNSSS